MTAERVVKEEVLRAISGGAVDAAIQAAEQIVAKRKERQRMIEMELE